MSSKNVKTINVFFDDGLFSDDSISFIASFLPKCINNTHDDDLISIFSSESHICIKYYKKSVSRKKNKENNPNIGNKE